MCVIKTTKIAAWSGNALVSITTQNVMTGSLPEDG